MCSRKLIHLNNPLVVRIRNAPKLMYHQLLHYHNAGCLARTVKCSVGQIDLGRIVLLMSRINNLILPKVIQEWFG